ncbi:MAG: hypothetical protein EKK41_19000 [Hyphomicrobiales bacterium]|nr:MAG: hypothetical protein EKK41_19000 [Hyphomicrobiales bacterium]
MADLFTGGRIVDIIFAVMAVEALVLILVLRRPAGMVATMLLPGACLLLALRGALTGAHWSLLAGSLALAFVAHLVDVGRRAR